MSAPTRILLALLIGLGAGIAAVAVQPGWAERPAAWAGSVGGMWLNPLRMTIVAPVVWLLVTGITASAKAARAGKLAGRAILLFVALLWASAIAAALLVPLLLGLFPLPAESTDALRGALGAAEQVGQAPGFADFPPSVVPSHPVRPGAELLSCARQ